jgi:hypothetical protein
MSTLHLKKRDPAAASVPAASQINTQSKKTSQKETFNPIDEYINKPRTLIQLRSGVIYVGTVVELRNNWLLIAPCEIIGTQRKVKIDRVWVKPSDLISHIHTDLTPDKGVDHD